MQLNHHILAKKTTDSVLAKFKSGEWCICQDVGPDFFRTGVSSSFPSPDAAFRCPNNKLTVSFEFKPPTENKRGILTGVGQAVAYLQSCEVSFLIIPKYLGDFPIAAFVCDLFDKQLVNKIPVGLISFDNDDPSNVELVQNVDFAGTPSIKNDKTGGRFWAKHQDLPIQLFHRLLEGYYLRKTNKIQIDAFEYCWNEFLFPESSIDKLQASPICDTSGEIIKTVAKTKAIEFGSKNFARIIELSHPEKDEAILRLKKRRDPATKGDSLYQSWRKNYVSLLKQLQVVDSEGDITESGIKFYHLGIVHGPNSLVFENYFARLILLAGKHLDVILDLEEQLNLHRGTKKFADIKEILQNMYEDKGMLKRNPNRIRGTQSNTKFLKFEEILWNALKLKSETCGSGQIYFNWKKITELVSLPEL